MEEGEGEGRLQKVKVEEGGLQKAKVEEGGLQTLAVVEVGVVRQMRAHWGQAAAQMVGEVEEAHHCLLLGEGAVDLQQEQRVSLEEVVAERPLQAVRCVRG